MAEASWEKYLWKRGLVALDPLLEHSGSLQLLDVVAKNGTEGFLSGRPTLVKVGSMCTLRSKNEAHSDWIGTKQRIEASLKELETWSPQKPKIDNDLFRKDHQLEAYTCHSNSGCGILASIVSLCRAGADASSYKNVSVPEVVFEEVKVEWLDAILERGRARSAVWEPDVAKIRRDTRGPHDPEKLEIWLVSEIKLGQQINLNYSGTRNASVGVDASALAGVPASAAVTVKSSTTGDLAATATSPVVPFAFKAIRLLYDNDGKFMGKKLQDKRSVKKGRPKKRADASSEFDANKNSASHMEGLFFRASELEGEFSEGGENDLECLVFVGVNQ